MLKKSASWNGWEIRNGKEISMNYYIVRDNHKDIVGMIVSNGTIEQ